MTIPTTVQLGPLTLHAYGLFFASAFFCAGVAWAFLLTRRGKSWDEGFLFAVYLIVSSVIGARLGFVLANMPVFLNDPSLLLNVRQGGMIFYGGIFGGALAIFLYSRIYNVPVLTLLDIGATGVTIGHVVGRVGCLVNGCCYGVPTSGWLHANFHGEMRIPVQLIEAGGNLILFGCLMTLFLQKVRPGLCLAGYLTFYGLIRFTVECFRGDPRMTWGSLHVAQWISLVAILSGLVLLFRLRKREASV